MPTTVQIAGWKVSGLRCPDHSLDFTNGSNQVHPITLLQMPNGTGKTTTLQLLRATLSGEASTWSRGKIRTFAKRSTHGGRGSFVVHLLINGRRTTFALDFDFSENSVRYTTTAGDGMSQGHHPARQVSRFFRPEFVNFFVFDGELAERLLSHDHTNAESAVDDLFQLGLFAGVRTALNDYWNEQVRRKGPGEEKGLTQRRNKVQKLTTRLAMLRREREEARKQYESLRSQLSTQKSRFEAALRAKREVGERMAEAERELAEASATVRSEAKNVLHRVRSPEALSSVFALEMAALKDSLDRVKLPESAAREFFEELADEEECVCGRPLDEALREAIRVRAAQYLGSEDVALLNAIKGDIAVRLGSDPLAPEQRLRDAVACVVQASDLELDARTERDAVQADGVASDPRLEQALETIERLEREVATAKDACDKYDNPSAEAGDDQTFGIRVLEKRLELAENKLAEVTETLEMKAKRDLLIELLDGAHDLAREGICGDVCRQANERVVALMPDNHIRIARIDKCLVLQGQEGGSVGENLSVAYAFLATLFNRTDHQLPFIVDSPANPIDLRVRAKVATLIPRLTGQFIAFTISSERQGFLEPLERAAEGPIQYVTLFRRGSVQLEESARREPSVVETTDGMAVFGRSYFHAFHVEEEAPDAVQVA